MLNDMENKENTMILTEEEANFCLLYVNAPAPLAGNATECYIKVFKCDGDDVVSKAKASFKAKKLLEKEAVKKRISELEEVNLYDTATLKQRITTTMLKIMDECSDETKVYKNRFKEILSPAPFRSVAISAAKLVAEVNGVKEDTVQKIQIGSENGEGITFNLIMPKKSENVEEQI